VTGTNGRRDAAASPLPARQPRAEDKVHIVVFFIMIVANCGGCLTPLGDPPLLLGFLKGVPFSWTLTLWKEWLVVCGSLVGRLLVHRPLALPQGRRSGESRKRR